MSRSWTASPDLPLPRLSRARADATTAPDPAPPRGPVLMGDLTTSLGGRPLLLWHWDRHAEDPADDQ